MGINNTLYDEESTLPNSVFSIMDGNSSPSNIVFYGHETEMLRVAKDGFYVRGVKVPQDNKEAETVYNAFLEFMTYSALTRNY